MSLFDKLFPYWRLLADGHLLVIFKSKRNSARYAFFNPYMGSIPGQSVFGIEGSQLHKSLAKSPQVKAILWSPMSSDALTFFCDKLDEKHKLALEETNDPVRYLALNYASLFQKYKIESDKDYVF